jgi:hypothetical protein
LLFNLVIVLLKITAFLQAFWKSVVEGTEPDIKLVGMT